MENKEITKKMKYEEFKELILKIDVKEIELDEIINKSITRYSDRTIVNPELEWMVEHLKNLTEYFEKRVNFESSKEREERRKKLQENNYQKQLEEGKITAEEYRRLLQGTEENELAEK